MGRVIRKPQNIKGDSVGLAYIIKYVHNRIEHDKNFMCAFIGPTGSGKSYGTLAIMELIYPNMKKQDIVDRVHFEPKPFLDAITNEDTKSGDMYSFDESGVGQNSKNWQSLINRMINYVLQTFRYKNLITFFCLPHLSFLDSDTRKLIHAVFETKTIDKSRNVLVVKPLFIQTNYRTGQMYFKYLRVKYKGSIVPIKSIEIPKPSDELIQLYREKKQLFAKDLYNEILIKVEMQEKKQQDKYKSATTLTEHQKKVLKLYQQYGTQQAAAREMNITQTSISNILRAVRRKLNVDLVEDLKKIEVIP